MRCVLVAILALALVAVAGCASYTADTRSASLSVEGQTLVLNASWPEKVLDLKELGRTADLVVSGIVESIGPAQIQTLTEGQEAGKTVVYTDAVIQPDQSLKGNAVKKSELSVRLLGGSVDGYTFVWQDEARLTEGDQVVLFLTDNPNPYYPRDNGFQYAVLWGMHGAFHMQGDIGTRSDEIPIAVRNKTRSEIEESVK